MHGGIGYDYCDSKLTLKKTKGNDYKMGVIDTTMEYYPARENKDLTCKGFTPIDWKAKFEAIKSDKEESYEDLMRNKPDFLTGYVKRKVYDDMQDSLKGNICTSQIWLICVSTALFLVSATLLTVYLKLG